MLLERPIRSFRHGKRWNNVEYQTKRDTSVEMGLYEDCNEKEKSLDECMQMKCTPDSARINLVTLYQQCVNPKRMLERHKSHFLPIYPRTVRQGGAGNCYDG